ncbi:uncharacterized protein LOC132293592 [Cornus florida]|uniref:uncharacterized protein LOC132293592 n=1 Tax=Cornus florida TaxID=4283 RepID=UPI0028A040E1|nr:uncharacterized protein LOC132293592 [Cornus florida]
MRDLHRFDCGVDDHTVFSRNDPNKHNSRKWIMLNFYIATVIFLICISMLSCKTKITKNGDMVVFEGNGATVAAECGGKAHSDGCGRGGQSSSDAPKSNRSGCCAGCGGCGGDCGGCGGGCG